MSDPWGHNPYQPPPGHPPHGYWGRPGTDGYAIASLVLGLLCVFTVTAVLAVVFGHMALDRINQTGQEGRGMAIAGLVLGYAWSALLLIGIVAVIADS